MRDKIQEIIKRMKAYHSATKNVYANSAMWEEFTLAIEAELSKQNKDTEIEKIINEIGIKVDCDLYSPEFIGRELRRNSPAIRKAITQAMKELTL